MAYKPLIVLAGGSGYLGRLLMEQLAPYYHFLVLGRYPRKLARSDYKVYPKSPEEAAALMEGAYALINLAGKSVDCRYTEQNKAEIMASRVDTTHYLAHAIQHCVQPPKVWVNISSATIYPDSQTPQREVSPTPGGNFSEEVCLAWENAFYNEETPRTRKVALRCGLVFGKNGGAYPVFEKLAKYALAGKQGKGNQYMSVLHEDDFVRAVQHVLEHRSMGSYNLCIPQPIPNKFFMKLLGAQLKLPFQIPQPEFLVKLGAKLIRTEAELVLKSRCVVPERLLNEGFQFKFDSCESILNVLGRSYFQSAENVSRSAKTGNLLRAS